MRTQHLNKLPRAIGRKKAKCALSLSINRSSPRSLANSFPRSHIRSTESNAEESENSRKLAEDATQKLRAKGLRADALVKIGDPKHELVKFAEEWRADCIFLGATGLTRRVERFLLGSVAGAVAARAHCSVEIVRKKSLRGHKWKRKELTSRELRISVARATERKT